jgi:hypothetical protein
MSGFERRALLRGGLTATVAGMLGALPGTVHATDGQATDEHAAKHLRIYRTSEWHARKPDQPIEVLNHPPTYILVHHTYDPGNSEDFSLGRAFRVARKIQHFHMDLQHWGDTGQQFTNSRGGYLMEGRHHSLAAVRSGYQHVVGAHVANHNSTCLGIENEGDYRYIQPPLAQWESLVELIAWIAYQYGLPVSSIRGHRDFRATECPGDALYSRLPELRADVAAVLGKKAGTESRSWPLLRAGDTGRRVFAAQHLLRTSGADVPVDGVFGTSTSDAVRRLVGPVPRDCTASRPAEEAGFLGADGWPLITSQSLTGEAAEAVRVLGGNPRRQHGAVDWQRLLA